MKEPEMNLAARHLIPSVTDRSKSFSHQKNYWLKEGVDMDQQFLADVNHRDCICQDCRKTYKCCQDRKKWAGICYLHGGKYKEIAHTIVNALAINSGMICDGAKSSCAAKIASAVEAGLLGWKMYSQGSQFYGGDGIVVKGVEKTIEAVSEIAREGMRSTDTEIIRIMLNQ